MGNWCRIMSVWKYWRTQLLHITCKWFLFDSFPDLIFPLDLWKASRGGPEVPLSSDWCHRAAFPSVQCASWTRRCALAAPRLSSFTPPSLRLHLHLNQRRGCTSTARSPESEIWTEELPASQSLSPGLRADLPRRCVPLPLLTRRAAPRRAAPLPLRVGSARWLSFCL